MFTKGLAVPDAPACPTTLLSGGTDVIAQGWTIAAQAPVTLTYGVDHVRLTSSTPIGGATSGVELLYRPGAVEVGRAFKLQFVVQVEAIAPHNQFDAAAAILGSFTPPFGDAVERAQMIYLDANRLGWADDTQSFATAVTDGAYHTYELAVDAGGAAQLRIDGAAAVTRNGFVTNGTIAIGDQTTDPGVDGALRIRSVTRLCP